MSLITPKERYVERHGITSEFYNVTTEDGYQLKMFRLLPKGERRGVVLLQHGLRESSASWLLLNQNLPLQLLERGIEVWLGNSRASTEGSSHKSLDRSSAEFWSFSFHEIGYYDLAAMVDFTMAASGSERIQVVAFSEGAAATLILLSKRPAYNEKISQLNLLAPAVLLSNSSYTVLAALYVTFKPILPWSLQRFVTGKDEFFGNSQKELEHLQHLMLSGRFVEYDYGSKRNRAVYGTSKVPEYPLEKVTCPVVLHYGGSDRVVHPRDVLRLSRKLANCANVEVMRHKRMRHLDFMTRKDAALDVYPAVVDRVVR
ncbi:hypothetical protein RP20_CCG025478 [Aedes albopictus]|nr:hypothetical protein RP20_CCG025478 [Aedes albopictus]